MKAIAYNKRKDRAITSNAIAYRLFKRRVSKIKRMLFGLMMILTPMATMANGGNTNPPEEGENALTIENLRKELIAAGVQHYEIVLRQAVLETGWFKCTNCSLSRNNIFGFYYKKRYLEYDSWKDCVAYYKRWQDRHYTGGDYYDFLAKVGFATSPTYIQKLKSIKGLE